MDDASVGNGTEVIGRGFCGDELWDNSRTWNTTDPDFTRCFQQTVLTWIPCGFLWIVSPWQAYQTLHNRFNVRDWSRLTLTKLILSLALVVLCITEMICLAYRWNSGGTGFVPSSELLAPFSLASAFLLAGFFVYSDRKAARQSSALLLGFWTLMLLTLTIQMRTTVRDVIGQSSVNFALVETVEDVANSRDNEFEPTGQSEISFTKKPWMHEQAENRGKKTFSVKSQPVQSGSDSIRLVLHAVVLPLVLVQFLLTFPSQHFPEREAAGVKPCPERFSSFPNRLVFWWFTSMAKRGQRKVLEQKDLWDLRHEDQTDSTAVRLEGYWKEELKQAQNGASPTKKPSLVRATFRTIWFPVLFTGILKLSADLITFAFPQLLRLLIGFVADSSIPDWKGYLYAVSLLAASFAQTVVNAHHYAWGFRIGMRCKAGFSAMIYRKALRIASAAKRGTSVGEIVNLMAVDAGKFSELPVWMHQIWSSPLQIGLALYFLYAQLGASVFAGLAFMILLLPINAAIGSRERVRQAAQMKHKDVRIKATNEALSGMKVLKLYAWEESFQKQILDVRDQELVSLRHAAYLQAVSLFVWNVSPIIVALVIFATYVLADERNVLNSEKVFVSLSLLNILRGPLGGLPFIVSSIGQNRVSMSRLARFFKSEELNEDNVKRLPAMDQASSFTAISVKQGNFSWGKDDPSGLKEINLNIFHGQLVAVVGKVGSGKSSLLAAMLGLMEKKAGQVVLKGSTSYVTQQAWIQNMTVEKNILFGKPLEQQRYRSVLKACALEPDLQTLPHGDQTEIGEKGVNISGGQKQRVSLARALYSNADVVLLDDPLSAVDAHVGKHLFNEVIGPKGVMAGKTRILVTHSISFLSQADVIVTMANGSIGEIGTYDQLMAKKGPFAELLTTCLVEASKEAEAADSVSDTISLYGSENNSKSRSRSGSSFSKGAVNRKRSRAASEVSQLGNYEMLEVAPAPVLEAAPLIADEKTEIGAVKFNVLLTYMKFATLPVFLGGLLGYATYSSLSVTTTIWLSEWSEDGYNPERMNDTAWRNYRLEVYGALGAVQALCFFIASITMAHGQILASRHLHQGMLLRIFRAPMWFFDTTPLGRIVNRFSKDIETVDVTLPMMMGIWIRCVLGFVATLVVICINIPYFALVILPLAYIYLVAQRFYVATSRQLKRLEASSRSPIFSHFQESLAGTSTIIATGQSDRFIAEYDARVDNNNAAYFPSMIAQRWLAVMLETVGNLMTFFSALFAVVGRSQGLVEPKGIGLSLTYTLSATMLLDWVVRSTSDLESHFVSVERLKEYTETPVEAEWILPENRPPKNWPQSGRVKFDDYQTRYRPGLDLVLKGVNADILGGEKIGIVGRTGAGKSSLTLALFRIIEPAGGTIVIDGLELHSLGLHDVRTHITIIPQEPVLFSGTLRMNLDPFCQYSDQEIWHALDSSHLRALVRSLPDGLQCHVAESGENLSVGQRQLVCLARALLRKTKILVLDEATAAIDLQTDELIQRTIREQFADCTVLTIAHRLNTVMDSDRVMVMDQGKVKEFGPPKLLLENQQSAFYSLAKDAGLLSSSTSFC